MGDDVQVGRIVREVRISRNLRQEDVAERAGLSRPTVSRLERGIIDGMTVGSLRAVSRALGMPPVVSLGWRSPEIDGLRDRLHAAMVETVVRELDSKGWETRPEFSFSHYGERGSVDVLAWHARSGTTLIVETKTRLWDLQDMLAALDRKRRLVPGLVARELGWKARGVGVVLVLPEMSTHRHVVDRHAATFRAAFPRRQLEVRRWLAEPSGDLRGIWYSPISRSNDIGPRTGRLRASKCRRSARHPPGSGVAVPKSGTREGRTSGTSPPNP